jgi:hypothetical protein
MLLDFINQVRMHVVNLEYNAFALAVEQAQAAGAAAGKTGKVPHEDSEKLNVLVVAMLKVLACPEQSVGMLFRGGGSVIV